MRQRVRLRPDDQPATAHRESVPCDTQGSHAMLTNLISRLATYFDPYELPDDADLLDETERQSAYRRRVP
jgi:hypothetical protein